MYIPRINEITDWNEIVKFVADIRAANLISVDNQGVPVATLMPCLWNTADIKDDTFGTLLVHMARANKQWRSIKDGATGLAIFQGPQAYISPSNYEEKSLTGEVVPTWNYSAVHLSGPLTISHDRAYLRKIVTDLSNYHESSRADPWDVAMVPEKYMLSELEGIVAVTMQVIKVEAKSKMSQNKTHSDQVRIIKDLESSSRAEESAVAHYMQERSKS